jgi:FlaA1/EpsC-like NDP-sugar epimerase
MKVRLWYYFRSMIGQLILGRTLLLGAIYVVLLSVALWFGYVLRFDFLIPEKYQLQYLGELPLVLLLKLIALLFFGQFGVLLSYFRLPDLYRIVAAMSLSSGVLVVAWYLFPEFPIPPRSVLLGDYICSLIFLGVFRTGLRVYRERMVPDPKGLTKQKRVAIVGAGRTGATLAGELQGRQSVGLRPVVFLDDDRKKWNHRIHGIPVEGQPEDLTRLKGRYGIEGLILAMSSASAKRILEITDIAQKAGISADIMPSMTELATGRVKASRIRPVAIEDLLGRESVNLDADEIRGMIEGKVVLVTGAGGSIGSELSRQINLYAPQRLIVVDQCEVQLYAVDMELRKSGSEGTFTPLIGNVNDETRMREIFRRYEPQVVFHAAAHKHVPIMEYQPAEAIKNNTLGTRTIARIAKEFSVERFILISTDKAINPTNVMGASKRLAEIFIQSLDQSNGGKTRFMAVRFGNVLGSSGSVVPLFRKQIAEGGPVTVTHPEVIRYFMTIPEAAGLVLQCATQASGGEIFVLDMGKPIKIYNLAERMIRLSGFEPVRDIEIRIVGLRPGEKLFEELQHVGETLQPTHHARILRFTGEPYPLDKVEAFFEELVESTFALGEDAIKEKIREFVPEYKPHFQ